MSNELIKAAAKSSSAIVGDVYKDLLQPSTQRIGFSLETLVKVGLSPIGLIDWGFEKSKDWLRSKIEDRLSRTPHEYIVKPTANIASAALTHISISYDTPELRELYAELLLKAMDLRTSASVHPAYFHIVEQLDAQEALVLVGLHQLGKVNLFAEQSGPYSYISGKDKLTLEEQFDSFCANTLSNDTNQAAVWLTNLCRLGLLSLQVSTEAVFRPEEGNRHGVTPAGVDNYEHRILSFTDFGVGFITACAPSP